jgi:hypothetical protein
MPKKIVIFFEIVLSVILLSAAVALAFEGIPWLLIFLSHYFSEVKLGLWLSSGGIALGLLALLFILLKKD